MQNKSFYFLSLLFLVFNTHISKANFEKSLSSADSLFELKKYTESFEIYEELTENDSQASPRMLLKMAFIKEGLGDYSSALYYLNLYYLHTSDKSVRVKMKEIAEEHNLSGFVINDTDFFINVLNKYETPIFISLLILSFIFASYILYQKIKSQKRPIITSIAFVFVLGGIYYLFNHGTQVNQGIIIENHAYLMSGPSSGSDLVEVIEKGHRVKTFEEHGPWLEIMWGGKIVYIKKSKVRKLG